MHILYLLNTYPAPSHSFIRREIHALERQGHQVTRLAMRRPAQNLVDADDQAEAARTHYVLAKNGLGRLARATLGAAVRSPTQFARALAMAWRLGRRGDRGRLVHLVYLAEAAATAAHAKACGATHIHAHFGTNPPAVALLARLLGGPRFSFTVHGPEEFDRPIGLALGEKIAHSAFCVAISSYGRSQLCRWAAPADWPKLKIVHCGIDPARFPDPQPLPSGGPNLVAIGRFAEQKGHLVLVEAMARVAQRLPKARLTLVGDGEMRPEVEAAITSAGLADHIHLAGWQDEAGVRTALANAQALVLPSFAEGLPVVAMEALAAGRPVIGTYIAGLPELVQPQECGWLVPAGDAQALANAIEDMAQTPRDTLSKMGLSGRARVLARHDVHREAAKLAAFIAEAGAPAPRTKPRAAAPLSAVIDP